MKGDCDEMQIGGNIGKPNEILHDTRNDALLDLEYDKPQTKCDVESQTRPRRWV